MSLKRKKKKKTRGNASTRSSTTDVGMVSCRYEKARLRYLNQRDKKMELKMKAIDCDTDSINPNAGLISPDKQKKLVKLGDVQPQKNFLANTRSNHERAASFDG